MASIFFGIWDESIKERLKYVFHLKVMVLTVKERRGQTSMPRARGHRDRHLLDLILWAGEGSMM
jgi:hypothetical protein